MKLLHNLFDTDEVIETDVFYWNLLGTDDDMPNFWYKLKNLQIEWYRDDPGRAAFSNYESEVLFALDVLAEVMESYANRRAEEKG